MMDVDIGRTSKLNLEKRLLSEEILEDDSLDFTEKLILDEIMVHGRSFAEIDEMRRFGESSEEVYKNAMEKHEKYKLGYVVKYSIRPEIIFVPNTEKRDKANEVSQDFAKKFTALVAEYTENMKGVINPEDFL